MPDKVVAKIRLLAPDYAFDPYRLFRTPDFGVQFCTNRMLTPHSRSIAAT
jgi:hypothetical protein